jgi:ABC-type Zn2+ transport system substrate-binding protein/surface adhesin
MMPPAIAPALLVAEELAAVLDGVVFASTPVGTVVDELDWLVENVVDELLPMVEDENEDEDEEEEEEEEEEDEGGEEDDEDKEDAVDEEAVLELVLIADELV